MGRNGMTTDLALNNFRESVMILQEKILQGPQVECPLVHHFAGGVYAREVTIPAGTVVIGKIHKRECINILIKGDITVVTEEGTRRMQAPCTFVAPPFTKKAAYTHTETIWMNVIATDSTDPEEIEKNVICEDYNNQEFMDYVIETLQIKE